MGLEIKFKANTLIIDPILLVTIIFWRNLAANNQCLENYEPTTVVDLETARHPHVTWLRVIYMYLLLFIR